MESGQRGMLDTAKRLLREILDTLGSRFKPIRQFAPQVSSKLVAYRESGLEFNVWHCSGLPLVQCLVKKTECS